MKYSIRKCEQKDLKKVVILCGHHASYEKCIYSENGKIEELTDAIFGVSAKLYCWVVDVEDTVVGYFSYTFDFSTWEARHFLYLDCLYLEPEYRGYGIGREIFTKLRAIARERDCINIQWQTPEFNAKAIKFYKKIGGKGKNKIRFLLDANHT